MSLNRWAKKVDRNHVSIVNALRMFGCSVEAVTGTEGCPDLVVGAYGVDQLVEVKPALAIKALRELRPSQVEWHSKWKGRKPVVVRTLEDCEALVNSMRGEGAKR